MTTWSNLGEQIKILESKKKKVVKKKKAISSSKMDTYYDKHEVYGNLDF